VHAQICTIGFAGKTAEEFFCLLEQAGVQTVIDIRENRFGQLSGYAKFPDIAYFLRRIMDIAYRHEPLFAPSPEIRKAYRKDRDWSRYEASFRNLMRERGVPQICEIGAFEGTSALLCSEPGPEKCHRRLVAELLAANWGSQGHQVEVKHLFLDRPAKRKTKKKPTADDPAHPH